MTHADATAAAYNAGVADVLDLARRCAEAIAARRVRPIAEGFAIEALVELAEAGRELLISQVEMSGPRP